IMGYREEGKWWVSQANYAPEVMSRYTFPKKIEILDTSLRDGEQQPGIILTRKDKVEIARKLAEAGVHRIEAGTPAVSQEDADAIKEICELDLGPKVFCFVRNTPDDMKLAKECGVHGVIAEVPGSEHLLKYGKKWTAEKAIKAAIEATQAAKELGLYVTFFPADSSRASMDFLMDSVQQISEEGHMDALALVDTFGCYSPEGAAYTVRKLKERFSQPIEVHFHDDFGLGVASTIAGLAAGAEVAHVTVNGIGERAGSAALEPLVLALRILYDYDTGIKLDKLKELSELVVELTRFKIQPTKPVVGDRIFGWETGMPSSLWLNCKDVEPLAMLPYLWNMTGQKEPEIYLGKKSGKDNIKKWLSDRNIVLEDEKAQQLLALVKNKSLELKRDITGEEFLQLVKTLS
ncbi:MAG TPA: pyruvate carboxyltransferase, partial [Negativicutes bacterium]|nr:pyruvate carboxyltransferase [Negativicutes bacterium]